ncbi:ATP-binding cassette sub-family G member 1-like [Chironomus tepperi]|uniref:ATP-binding cassette sub-family G member 1-like n=1 Tax=Chironomus tepperi TaxID=113505 RepID=UPI00391F7BCD
MASNMKFSKDINISFENITYSTKVGFFKKNDKLILNDLSGEFRSRELTAIMGPSGSGKSTLLDILSGYNNNNKISGRIKVNESIRDPKQFRHISSYIMQDNFLQPLLTVQEAMSFCINLKIGKELSDEQKEDKIEEILLNLGLHDKTNVMTEKLSGGQQKRLSIALELITNPQLMFFDEVTTGLDSVSSSQCIQLLKSLAENGRTIICTIHQPSASIFESFDHLYAIAEGQCIYQGESSKLVPYLSKLDLDCPEFYNPSDYLLELSTRDYGVDKLKILINAVKNGENQEDRNHLPLVAESTKNTLKSHSSLKSENNPISMCVKKAKLNGRLNILDPRSYCNDSDLYSTSFLRQFYYLYLRTFLLITRNPSLSLMRLMIHFFVAIFIGLIYFQIGNSAKNLMNNFKFIFYTVMFLMFTAFSSLQTTFPSELPVIKREHFNRWYSFSAYFTSLTLADLPMQILCTVIYIVITYFLTDQPLELFRFSAFFTINLLCTFVAQGYGLVVSSLFNVKWGTILGNFFICPFLIFSGFFVQMKHIHEALHWLFHISFLKYALEGSVYSIIGFNRTKIECDEFDKEISYCRYSYPNQLLRDIGIQDCAKNSTINENCDAVMLDNQRYDFVKVIIVLALFIIFFRAVAFCIMRYRLKN